MRITILAAIVLCLIGVGIYSIASNNKKEVEAVTAPKQLFVATDGDDENEGTKEKPLRTIQAAVDRPQLVRPFISVAELIRMDLK